MRIGAAVVLFLAIQACVATWVYNHDPGRVLAPDSPSYEMSAVALLVNGRFWTAPGSGEPQIHRTPGYPALIAASYALFGRNPTVVIAIQLLMNCVMLVLVGRIAGRVGVAAGWAAVLVLGLDVAFFASAQYLLTETFFTLQLVLFVMLRIEMRRPTITRSLHLVLATVAGVLLATMGLTRPIAYYLPALVAILMVFVARRDGLATRLACMSGVLLLLPAVVILGMWQVRNVRVSGSAEFSQIKNVNLLMYRAAGVVALRDGISLEAARHRLQRELERQYPDLDGARLLDAAGVEARRILRAEPLLAARTVAEGFAKMMFVPGENALLHLLGVNQPTGPAGDLMRLGFSSFVQKWVVGRSGEFLLFAFALLHLAVMYGLAVIGLWRLPPQAMAVLLILYLVVLSSGPEAYPRFRVPIAPLLAMLAGVGYQHLRSGFARARPRRIPLAVP